MQETVQQPKNVVVAMQGGAALGAFGWGVLDRLLDEPGIAIEGISGTSSGAVNATLYAFGMLSADRGRTKEVLRDFWKQISDESDDKSWGRLRSLRILGPKLLQIRQKDIFLQVMSRLLLPYQFDPKTMDPLRSVIANTVDFEHLRTGNTVKLFINATDIETNKNRVFSRRDVSIDALCASCCLPFLFDSIEIDGAHYWDGGYMGNPTIYPLINNCEASDIILVLTSHLSTKGAPKSAAEIINRVSQVSFTSALMREMRAIKFVTDLIKNDHVKPEAGLRKVNIHIIAPPHGDQNFEAGGGFRADWSFMEDMKSRGSNTATDWLDKNMAKIGKSSSVDLESLFC